MASFKGILCSVLRRRRRSVSETLESIDSSIAALEEHKASKVSSASTIAFHVIFYASIIYVTVLVVSYFLFRPFETLWKIVFIIFAVVYPLLVWLVIFFINSLYFGSADRADKKMNALLKQKRKILEDVMSTETYNRAQQLLKRFDPSLYRNHQQPDSKRKHLQDGLTVPTKSNSEMVNETPQSLTQTPAFSKPSLTAQPAATQPVKGPITHRPILPHHRSIIDVVLDVIVGDGPSRRYALICQQCSGHNGMALAEEFEFIAFRCCYCGFHNPARRIRRPLTAIPQIGAFPTSSDSSSSQVASLSLSAGRRLQSTSDLNLTSVGRLQSSRISASTANMVLEKSLPSAPSWNQSCLKLSPATRSFSSIEDFQEQEPNEDFVKTS